MKSLEFNREKKTPRAILGDGDTVVINGQEAFRDRSIESNDFPEGNDFTSLDQLNKKSA